MNKRAQDFLSGHQVRAPRWVRRMALEWFWRMASNPRRLARRYAGCAMLLPALAIDGIATRFVPLPASEAAAPN